MDKEKAIRSLEVLDEEITFDGIIVGKETVDVHELFFFIISILKGEKNDR